MSNIQGVKGFYHEHFFLTPKTNAKTATRVDAPINTWHPLTIIENGFFKTVAAIVNLTTSGIEKLVLPALINFSETDKKILRKIKSSFLKNAAKHAQEISFRTSDGAMINAAAIRIDKKPFENSQWIVFFNGNGMCYENNLKYMEAYGRLTQKNVLLFNYRGVVDSKGYPQSYEDLVRDGDAAFEYLLQKGVNSKNILIDGISLGGAIGTFVRALHPDGPIANRNSFSSIGKIMEGLFYRNMTRSCLHQNGKKNHKWKAQLMGTFISKVLKAAGWEINVVPQWEKILGHKWIVSATEDELITGVGKFYTGVKASQRTSEIIHIKSVGKKHNDLMTQEAFERHIENIKIAMNQQPTLKKTWNWISWG